MYHVLKIASTGHWELLTTRGGMLLARERFLTIRQASERVQQLARR